ncbi:hypothetical protein BU16DRAFT_75406 [Lophium mytilinum]|uniref:Uncharacterized protein n=1 Tax=Lophium mytilinum TaxID=390894 RepID=A0A6A6QNF8_9PEZI|nr:hypothetical protein BU16DRAFT_75406 [Lophium mytilinum]
MGLRRRPRGCVVGRTPGRIAVADAASRALHSPDCWSKRPQLPQTTLRGRKIRPLSRPSLGSCADSSSSLTAVCKAKLASPVGLRGVCLGVSLACLCTTRLVVVHHCCRT